MKVRTDFVTNSSSSSFIVYFSSKEEMETYRKKLLRRFSPTIVRKLIKDIEKRSVSYHDIKEWITDEFISYRKDSDYYNAVSNPESPYHDKGRGWFSSDEYYNMIKPDIDKEVDDFLFDLDESGIFAIVEYFDSTEINAFMERTVMPDQDFVLYIKDNH